MFQIFNEMFYFKIHRTYIGYILDIGTPKIFQRFLIYNQNLLRIPLIVVESIHLQHLCIFIEDKKYSVK